jgi:hypothetical protein
LRHATEYMKKSTSAVLAALFLGGCTTGALHENTKHQAMTVQDILADEILYNLAVAKDFNENKTFNGIPSFVTLVSGNAQIQDSITPQFSTVIPTHGGANGTTFTPQISGVHQTQDSWLFSPVVDPTVLNRLFWLYRSQFTNISTKILTTTLFPPQPDLDQLGRPNLSYQPVLIAGTTNVQMNSSNSPIFTASVKPSVPKDTTIPGALIIDARSKTTIRTNGWWSFEEPNSSQTNWFEAKGTYRGKRIWITNSENFFNFAILALGGTNGSSGLTPPAAVLFNQSGPLLTPYLLR